MTISRRSFFRTLFAAAAAGALLTDSKVAQAISAFPEDRVSIIVKQARALVSLCDSYEGSYRKPEWTGSSAEATCRDHATAFMVDINRLFPEMNAVDEAHFLMEGLIKIDLMDDATIVGINPEIVPLGLLKEVVQNGGVRRSFTLNLPGLSEFVARYAKAVFQTNVSVAARSVKDAFELVRYDITPAGRTLLLKRYYAARDAGKLDQPVDFSGDDYQMYTSQEMV